MSKARLLCPHDGTPLRHGYGRLSQDGTIHRRRDCPHCGARFETREEIIATNRPPIAARGVPGNLEELAR